MEMACLSNITEFEQLQRPPREVDRKDCHVHHCMEGKTEKYAQTVSERTSEKVGR